MTRDEPGPWLQPKPQRGAHASRRLLKQAAKHFVIAKPASRGRKTISQTSS